jgi:DNA-binding GntR family transcriptional regulator
MEWRYQTKALLAAEALRSMIRGGELAPGERLDLGALAEQLRMSATPIREALRQLEAEGLVVSQSYRGIRVAAFTQGDAIQLYDLRALLESHATNLAVSQLSRSEVEDLEHVEGLHRAAQERGDRAMAARHNATWHFRIYDAAGRQNPLLMEFIGRLWNAFPWTTAWMVPGRAERSVRDHAEIMLAIRGGDAKRAGSLMNSHVLAGKAFVMDRLATAPRKGPRLEKGRRPKASD